MPSLLARLYRLVARPLLFLVDAERAHRMVARLLGLLHRRPGLRRLVLGPPAVTLPVEAFGRRFPSPVGVAAGFDKAGELYNALGGLGFGFVEVGTVTALPQPGNPLPRLFRLPADRALVNRMGFNNPGATAVAAALRRHPPDGIVLGVNIGKSKAAPLDEAPADYARSARELAPLADYLVVNVSSPNTPGLRSLQSVEALRPVLAAVQHELAGLDRRVPLLVKIAPDLADDDVDAIVDLALDLSLDGLIATNTTIGRAGLRSPDEAVLRAGEGGLSGPPVHARMIEVVRRIRRRAGDRLTVIAVGGIEDAEQARAAIEAGAKLVQLYTGLVYRGPEVAREIVAGLAGNPPKS